MSKGKTIQEQFTELTPPRLKEIRGCIVRKYLSEKISELENGEYELPISKYDATNLMDSILYQNDRTVHLFNPTAVAISGVLPYNYRNELNENAIPSGLYPNMIDDFYYNRCWISESRGSEISQLSPDLYVGSTRCSTQVKAI